MNYWQDCELLVTVYDMQVSQVAEVGHRYNMQVLQPPQCKAGNHIGGGCILWSSRRTIQKCQKIVLMANKMFYRSNVAKKHKQTLHKTLDLCEEVIYLMFHCFVLPQGKCYFPEA